MVLYLQSPSSIKVLSQGVGYAASTTTVSVKSPGDSATFSTKVRRLVANKYKTSSMPAFVVTNFMFNLLLYNNF